MLLQQRGRYGTQLIIKKMEEYFKEIPNFDGRYSISNLGTVKDNKRNTVINPHFSGVERRNYHQVTLYAKKETRTLKKTKRVHSLMAMTFLGFEYNGERKYVVDHIDNNPLNNNLNNLQIVSMKVNNTKDKRR